jgi:hypothetical protein
LIFLKPFSLDLANCKNIFWGISFDFPGNIGSFAPPFPLAAARNFRFRFVEWLLPKVKVGIDSINTLRDLSKLISKRRNESW